MCRAEEAEHNFTSEINIGKAILKGKPMLGISALFEIWESPAMSALQKYRKREIRGDTGEHTKDIGDIGGHWKMGVSGYIGHATAIRDSGDIRDM